MDPINTFKGYGKIDNLEDQTQLPNHHTTRRLVFTTVSISAILLLTLFLGLILGSLIYESNTKPPESGSVSSLFNPSNPAESIKAVCNVTSYPNSCFTSISPLNTAPKPDPEDIFKLSLKVSIAELSQLWLSVKDLGSKSNGGPALKDCESQIEDALSRLNDSLVAMELSPGEKMLTETRINDIQTWISAAMTDQETCLDWLEEMGSTALVDEFKKKMKKAREYVSNSLAIVANIRDLLRKFCMTLH